MTTKKKTQTDMRSRIPAIRGAIVAGMATVMTASPVQTQAAECKPLRPQVSQGRGAVVETTIGPRLGFNSHGNTFFLVDGAVNTITITLTPNTTDTASYPTQLVSRYNDDSIYESGAPIFHPKTKQPIVWGPLKVNQPGKELVAFNVKILENFHLYPASKGFSYKLSAIGCK